MRQIAWELGTVNDNRKLLSSGLGGRFRSTRIYGKSYGIAVRCPSSFRRFIFTISDISLNGSPNVTISEATRTDFFHIPITQLLTVVIPPIYYPKPFGNKYLLYLKYMKNICSKQSVRQKFKTYFFFLRKFEIIILDSERRTDALILQLRLFSLFYFREHFFR